MKQIFNRYELISIILDNMQISNQDERDGIRPQFANLKDSDLLNRFPMFQSIRKGFYTTV